jgi:hypothetical protein
MKKYLLITLTAFSIYVISDDLDLGADFQPGDKITASEFNSKFNELKVAAQSPKDSDLIGAWNCKVVSAYQKGGLTQINGGFLWTKDAILTLSETDNVSSISSPKIWTTSVNDVLYNTNDLNGTYSLIGNLFMPRNGENTESNGEAFLVNMTSKNQFSLSRIRSGGGAAINLYIICNK